MGERNGNGLDFTALKVEGVENGRRSGVRSHFVVLIATGLYSGFCPLAPGTAGTLVGVAVYLLVLPVSPLNYLATIIPILLVGVWFSGKAEVIFGKKDHQAIVIDEVCGFIVAMFMVPRSLVNVFWGVALFRLFDIWKPLGRIEKLKRGFGVVADDLVAGISANIVLQFLRLFGFSWP